MTDERPPSGGDPEDRDPNAYRDELPGDLDVTSLVGPYRFPDVARRRTIGGLYVLVAAGCVAAGVIQGVTAMYGVAALLTVVAVHHVLTGWRLSVDETDALVVATRAVGFPIGHASAQLAWRGFRSRPTWRILLYSAEDPPRKRGLVELDGVDGAVLGQFTEDNPEDWSQYR